MVSGMAVDRAFRRLLPLWLFVVISPASAQELPLWEFGAGIAYAYLPYYRGSDQYLSYLFPIPYFVYRGETQRVDRRGARTELLQRENISLNINASIGAPARSAGNSARAGMPNLDPTIEAGPSLNVRLNENPTKDRLWSLRLPFRAVVATDLSHAQYVGWSFLPNVAYDVLNIGNAGWNLGVSAGPIWAGRQYHEYYYSVAPQFATPTRPAFDARGGYSGASIGATLTKRYPNYWIGAFIRYDSLHNAVFEDSPLVRSQHAFFAGVAVSAILARSDRTVEGDPSDTEP